MISIPGKSKNDIPDFLLEVKDQQQEIAITANKSLIKPSVYKVEIRVNGKRIFQTRDLLKEIYKNKCAYCESIEHKPEIEHYRPKKRVSKEKDHPGYYWLCYEWSNLLPSCRYCNTEGGKGNLFPILGTRVMSPSIFNQKLNFEECDASNSPLRDEIPYLLHPEIDKTEDYFSFNSEGKIIGIDSRKRGEMTIEICNLNRDNLLFKRKKKIDQIVRRINDNIHLFETNRNITEDIFSKSIDLIFHELIQYSESDQEYSLLSQKLFFNFKELVIQQLITETQRQVILKFYTTFYSSIQK